jgi:hypothetical protein
MNAEHRARGGAESGDVGSELLSTVVREASAAARVAIVRTRTDADRLQQEGHWRLQDTGGGDGIAGRGRTITM